MSTRPARPQRGGKGGGLSGFLGYCAANAEARDTIRAMLAAEAAPEPWRGLVAVPPGSPVDGVLGAFFDHTDIPLEIPFFALMHFVSGRLLAHRIKIQGASVACYPDLWTVVLADSGAGKTFAHNILAKASPVKSDFPEVASGARFIEAFEKHNFGLWFQDEIAQKIKQIESINSPMADVKEYLLRAYGYDRIERSTKKETITIAEPCLGIFGLNTPESFTKALKPESLLDGFAARFGYVLAGRDPARPMIDFPLYNLDALNRAAQAAFATLAAVPLPPVFTVPPATEVAFAQGFKMVYRGDIPEAFFRRIMFRAFKYAAIYHTLLGKETATIDPVDMGWAARVCAMNLADMRQIAESQGLLREALTVAARAKKMSRRWAMKGRPLTARAVQQHFRRDIDTAAAARAVVALVD